MSLSFISFARAHGGVIEPAKLIAGERLRRCPTIEHPRKENGAYFWDGHRGWVFNWEDGAKVQWWNDPSARPWTEAEKAEWKRKRDAANTAQQKQYEQAAKQARRLRPFRHEHGKEDTENQTDQDLANQTGAVHQSNEGVLLCHQIVPVHPWCVNH